MSEPRIKPVSAEDRKLWKQHNIDTLREWRAIPFTKKIQMVEEMEELARSMHGGKLVAPSSERKKNRAESKIHLAETPEEQQAWMRQWRLAEVALRQVKREELRKMTEEDVLNTCDILLTDVVSFYRSPETVKNSGLVEQQRVFARAHQKV